MKTNRMKMVEIGFLGLALVLVPLVCLNLGLVVGEWATVAHEIRYPLIAVFVLGVCFTFLFDVLRINEDLS